MNDAWREEDRKASREQRRKTYRKAQRRIVHEHKTTAASTQQRARCGVPLTEKTKKMRPGTSFVRAPSNNRLTDWSGRFLDWRLRLHFQPGNIVRVSGDAYVRIDRVCKHVDWLSGIVQDPYADRWTWHRNGERLTFHRRQVSEVPLDWQGNEQLSRHARRLNTWLR